MIVTRYLNDCGYCIRLTRIQVVDLDRMVRVCIINVLARAFLKKIQLSNEFDFPLDTILHGSDAWLVPELLKKAYVLFNWKDENKLKAIVTEHMIHQL